MKVNQSIVQRSLVMRNPDFVACLQQSLDLALNCLTLCTFPDSLDPDQTRQNVGPDLDPNTFLTL